MQPINNNASHRRAQFAAQGRGCRERGLGVDKIIRMAKDSIRAVQLIPRRLPVGRLGVSVVAELVDLIVTGRLKEGDLLPPEAPLSEHFGVSRTVLRESVKRLEEKGLVTVSQGRGTQVRAPGYWNMLDPVVLSALIDNDESLGVLDELTVVRASLESAMAGAVAGSHSADELRRLENALTAMRESESETDSFRQADVIFHYAVMEISGNRLAENIAKQVYKRAVESSRYQGINPPDAVALTLKEHEAIVKAIARNDVAAAEKSMHDHICGSWERRRLSDNAPRPRGRRRGQKRQ
ncbi:FadR/GntR family transcriptional regulator [Kribbella sp. NPDC026596]|uniref:FadR/GntR family transcriptional regulator n=1 Tax=Kribbella sp. NPDC026596 TaxID=3155122 RepID=UPI003411AD5E